VKLDILDAEMEKKFDIFENLNNYLEKGELTGYAHNSTRHSIAFVSFAVQEMIRSSMI
jgi:hypothetical protein